MEQPALPVPVREHPYWRVLLRPTPYDDSRLPTLAKCWEVVEQNRVQLRGWDYPHVSRREEERGRGTNWVASWSDFGERYEYWRLYQSGQFVHLFSVREATEPRWRERLQADARSHLGHMKHVDWNTAPGFINITNFIYSMTEILEFAARLAQRGVYTGSVELTIELHGIKGFALMADWNRAWHSYYATQEDSLKRKVSLQTDQLVADSASQSLEAILWFFERFGWDDAPVAVLKHDQEGFLSGRR